MIGNFSKGFCVRLCNSVWSMSRQGTCPCLIPLHQLSCCPLLSPAPQLEGEQGGGFLQQGYKIRKQTCCVQSGRNLRAASLRSAARAKGRAQGWKGWGYATGRHTLHNAPLNPTFEKHLGNSPESKEYPPLARGTGLHPHTFNWAP